MSGCDVKTRKSTLFPSVSLRDMDYRDYIRDTEVDVAHYLKDIVKNSLKKEGYSKIIAPLGDGYQDFFEGECMILPGLDINFERKGKGKDFIFDEKEIKFHFRAHCINWQAPAGYIGDRRDEVSEYTFSLKNAYTYTQISDFCNNFYEDLHQTFPELDKYKPHARPTHSLCATQFLLEELKEEKLSEENVSILNEEKFDYLS